MQKKVFLFLFIFLISINFFGLSSATLNQFASIASANLPDDEDRIVYRFNDYFGDYNRINITYRIGSGDLYYEETQTATKTGTFYTLNCGIPYFVEICFGRSSGSDDVLLRLIGDGNYEISNITIKAINDTTGAVISEDYNIIHVASGFRPPNPQQIASILPADLSNEIAYLYYFDDYFTSFDYISLNYTLNNSNYQLVEYISTDHTYTITNYDHWEFQFGSLNGRISLYIYPHGQGLDFQEFLINIKAGNTLLIPVSDYEASSSLLVNNGEGNSLSSAPYQIASILSPLYVGPTQNENEILYFGNYFLNFDNAILDYSDDTTSTSVHLERSKTDPNGEVCYTGDYYICLGNSGSSIYINLKSASPSIDKTKIITLTAENAFGQVNSSFQLISISQSNYSNPNDIPTNEWGGTSFIGALTSVVNSIFPDKSSLSIKNRFGFVLVTLLLVNLLLGYFMFQSGNAKFLGILLLIINAVLLFYFTSIGYIPIVLVIIIFLILLAFTFFKLRGGG